MGINQGPGVLY